MKESFKNSKDGNTTQKNTENVAITLDNNHIASISEKVLSRNISLRPRQSVKRKSWIPRPLFSRTKSE